MALITGGTQATSSLNGLRWTGMPNAADFASVAANIKSQSNPAHPIVPGGLAAGGLIDFPDRVGFLNLKPGDYVFYDNYGWPIVISAESMTSGSSWTHS